jgi:RNA polymerase primary sigma factor
VLADFGSARRDLSAAKLAVLIYEDKLTFDLTSVHVLEDVETDEAIGRLMEILRPREQEVLSLRFGLGGQPRLSLSQVGKALSVSKERVRQIQDRALEKLRGEARHLGLEDLLVGV